MGVGGGGFCVNFDFFRFQFSVFFFSFFFFGVFLAFWFSFSKICKKTQNPKLKTGNSARSFGKLILQTF